MAASVLSRTAPGPVGASASGNLGRSAKPVGSCSSRASRQGDPGACQSARPRPSTLVVGVVLPATPIGKFPRNRPHRQCIVAEMIMKLDQPGKYDSRGADGGCTGKIRWRGSRTVLNCANALTIDIDGARREHRERGIHCGDPSFQRVSHQRIPCYMRHCVKELCQPAPEL